MADKGSGDKPIKNSLLTAASTGFSLEDFSDARLLVPASLQEEILKISSEATSEIDLESDDVSLDDPAIIVPQPGPEEEESGKRKSILQDSPFMSFFTGIKGDTGDAKSPREPHASSPPSQVRPEPTISRPLLPPKVENVTLTSPELLPVISPLTSPEVLPVPVLSPVSSSESFGGVQSQERSTTAVEKNELSLMSGADLCAGVEGIALFNPTFVPDITPTLFTPAAVPPADGRPALYNPAATPSMDSTPALLNPAAMPPGDGTPVLFNPAGIPPADGTPSGLYNPTAPTVQHSVQPVVGAPAGAAPGESGFSSGPANPSSQGTSVNKYRLGSQRPQYAQYPGLLPTVPAATTMGNLASQPPPVQVSSGAVPPSVGRGVGSVQSATSPLTPSFPQEYVGTGYVFGEPPPMKAVSSQMPMQYTPVSYHWFYCKEVEGKVVWKPFSFLDSVALEDAYLNGSTGLVATDGGRYDVNVLQRLRMPVYWEETATEVRRCSWFYKGPLDNRFVPYEEEFAQQIEDEFEAAISTGIWQRRVELGGGEAIILHNPNVIVHFCQAAAPDEWGNVPESQLRPRVVKRGVDKSFMIEDGEAAQIDHLVFLVHGIGAICDFKFRSIVEAVDDFRSLSNQILHVHFSNAVEKGMVGRIEFLPVCWHKALHGDCGVDRKLKPITLQSIPKLRHFTNDTLLDILFYTSPVYCQRIVDTVGNEINRMFNLFLTRNLNFDGSVSLSGHSLGSLILFDLLTHQPDNIRVDSKPTAASSDGVVNEAGEGPDTATKADMGAESEKEGGSSKMVSYTIGHAGTGQPSISYPAFDFHPTCFFALGSPTAVFISVRGIDELGQDFKLPTCRNFFNIFHPYDPVAYRMEPLIDPNFDKTPVVIPHHKGRKRFHLEIKDAMFKMGTDLKQSMVETIKNTWKTVYSLASFGRADGSTEVALEREIDRVIEGELSKSSDDSQMGEVVQSEGDVSIGQLNGGRRIDYVLQEGPLESFNEYLFALSSHVCYWESEDTMLMIMKEIYKSIGVYPDNVPGTYSSAQVGSGSGGSSFLPQQPVMSAAPPPYATASRPSVTSSFENPSQYPSAHIPPSGPPPSYSYAVRNDHIATQSPSPSFYNPTTFNPPMQVNITNSAAADSRMGNNSNSFQMSQAASQPPYVPVMVPQYQANNPVPTAPLPGTGGGHDIFSSDSTSFLSRNQDNQGPTVASATNLAFRNPSPIGPPPLSGFVRKS